MPLIGTPLAFDTRTYKKHLCAKFSELQGIVEANLVEAFTRQKIGYDKHARPSRQFKIGDPVWLSIPTAGKLSPKWKGNWRISSIKSQSQWRSWMGRDQGWCTSIICIIVYNLTLQQHQRWQLETEKPGTLLKLNTL